MGWRRTSSRNYAHIIPSSNHQQSLQLHQQYSSLTGSKQQINGSVRSTKTSTVNQKNESVKTVKRRLEKMKDQKAAKTLRFIFEFFIK